MNFSIDFVKLVNQFFYIYDKIEKKENLAINDLIQGLREGFPRINQISQSVDIIKLSIADHFLNSTKFFNQINWWYLHSISNDFVIKNCKMGISENEFNDLVINHFKEFKFKRLKSIINKWGTIGLEIELCAITNQILNAHIRGDYYLTVCTMIPIIERLILKTHNNYYDSNMHKVNTAIKRFNSDFESSKIYFSNFLFILEMFYKSGDFNEIGNFNRHKIVHGQTLDFGKEIYSLKLMLAIDEILRFRNFTNSINFGSKK